MISQSDDSMFTVMFRISRVPHSATHEDEYQGDQKFYEEGGRGVDARQGDAETVVVFHRSVIVQQNPQEPVPEVTAQKLS